VLIPLLVLLILLEFLLAVRTLPVLTNITYKRKNSNKIKPKVCVQTPLYLLEFEFRFEVL